MTDAHILAWEPLGAVAADSLVAARHQAHFAVQWPSRIARGFLPARGDDSQASLLCEPALGGLFTAPIPRGAGAIRAGIRIRDLTLIFTDAEGAVLAEYAIHGRSDAGIGAIVNAALGELGLDPARLPRTLPYEPPEHEIAQGGRYDAESHRDALAELGRYFGNFHPLLRHVAAHEAGAGPVYTWPHHFDMASLILLGDDAEASPQIGVGLSPGDGNYAEPYLYVSVWPRIDEAGALPELPRPAFWHTRDFLMAALTGSDMAGLDGADVAAIIAAAVAGGRAGLQRIEGRG